MSAIAATNPTTTAAPALTNATPKPNASPKKAAAGTKASPKKSVKSPKAAGGAKKPKQASSHPTYGDMIKRAINELKEKKGSSRAAILKYILANYKVGVNIPQVDILFLLNYFK